MLPFPDLLPEVDQYKFFHDEPLEADYQPRRGVITEQENLVEDDLGPVEFEQVIKLNTEVNSMSWSNRFRFLTFFKNFNLCSS